MKSYVGGTNGHHSPAGPGSILSLIDGKCIATFFRYACMRSIYLQLVLKYQLKQSAIQCNERPGTLKSGQLMFPIGLAVKQAVKRALSLRITGPFSYDGNGGSTWS